MHANDDTGETRDARPTRGELLRRYRRLAGLTQEELAARSWYSADYIGKLERGQRRLSEAALERLAGPLGLGAAELAAFRASHTNPEPLPAPTHRLVGRDQELSEIRRLLAGLGPPTLLFAGEPGIGKTRLLDEAAVLAEQTGWRVVRGGCHRRGMDPYAPLTDALSASLGRLSHHERAAALRGAGQLDLLLPELRAGDDSPRTGDEPGDIDARLQPERTRRLLSRAVAAYLRAIAAEHGTLLILDDLQWAGPDALDLLTTLIGADEAVPLRLLGAYRNSEAQATAAVGDFNADLARASLVRVLPLGPLTAAAAAELTTALLPADDAPRLAQVPAIVQRAGGVPFYLVSYVADLLGRHDVALLPEVPWTVAQVIRQRVGAMPAPVRELLEVAAVVGRAVVPALFARVTDQAEGAVIAALEAASEARLLEEASDGGYRLAHDLIRDTIEGDLSAARRRLLHRRVAEALEHLPEWQRPGGAAEVARHFLQADDRERALIWALQAGDRAAGMFASANAETHYRIAADLAREIGDMRREVEALDKLGHVLYRSGRFRAAVEPLERAGELYARLGDRARAMKMVARSGEAYGFGGLAAEGLERLLPVVRGIETADPGASPRASAADLSTALSTLYLHAGRVQHALETAQSAIALAASSGNLQASCFAEICYGLALGRSDRLTEERRAFARATEIAEQVGDPWLLALAVYHQGVAARAADDFEEGEREMRRALDIADRAGLVAWATFIRANLSDLLAAHGRWIEAQVEAERAEAENRYLGPRPGSFYPLHALGRILLLRGEREAGLRNVQESLALATRYEHLPGIFRARETLAWQAMRDDRPAEAIARLGPALERSDAVGRPRFPSVHAWALLELGDLTRAAEVLDAARQQARTSRSRATLPNLLLAEARLAVCERRWDDAVAALEQGVAIAQEIEFPYDEALLLQEHGRMLAARGEPERARARLEQALTIFRRLGAAFDLTAVEHALAALQIPG